MEFTSKIKTVADAFAYTNRDITVLQHLESLPQQDVLYMSSLYQRMVVTEALNKEDNGGVDWTPSYGDSGVEWRPNYGKVNRKYESWCWLKKNPNPESVGFMLARMPDYVTMGTDTICGARLCFKSKELVLYFNSQFSDLLMDTMIPGR